MSLHFLQYLSNVEEKAAPETFRLLPKVSKRQHFRES